MRVRTWTLAPQSDQIRLASHDQVPVPEVLYGIDGKADEHALDGPCPLASGFAVHGFGVPGTGNGTDVSGKFPAVRSLRFVPV
jgi:hypothetical protein